MSAWQRLDDELSAWRDGGHRATLWCRDDDACRDTPALRRLLAVARAGEVPVALAVIPAVLEPGLADAVVATNVATVVQHGYAHRNHAPPGARKCELGADRPPGFVVAELDEGRARLALHFGERFVAVLVPPWNRIAPDVVARLPGGGFCGLSTFGPRRSARTAPDLVQCNTHVDLIAWRAGRTFIGAEHAIARLVENLRAQREGLADPAEPTGILTHHLDLTDDAWQFLTELFARTRNHDAAGWVDVNAAFGCDAAASLTSDRSA